MNCYPFIEAEKAQQRNVKRACELLEVSRAAFYQHLDGPSRRDQADAGLIRRQPPYQESRAATARGCTPSCGGRGAGMAASGSPG